MVCRSLAVAVLGDTAEGEAVRHDRNQVKKLRAKKSKEANAKAKAQMGAEPAP